ncbi:GNAT family N-acetyltransferase [Clostridium tagluense]|uniref:GNAT family N-acetyltransferase n=1 Tax=Clostridium tagluense TaxID=360422 RepID=UPI001C0B5658|nr:GNAT family N-acetyltransferase [Clostridium tagluense]MBU3130137.1 GNAT family N-acetyltransferase [Clostridium tagluense]
MITETLIIRLIEKSDYDDICEYGCDEEIGQYMIYWPKTKDHIKEFIDKCVASINSDKTTWYEFVMQLKDASKVIGNITLEVREAVAEIGWISNKKYWNNGYMSEAVNAVIDYAFQHLGIHRIIATCTEKNVASFKVMEKCNMVKIKTEKNQKALRQGIDVTYNKLTYCIERV